MPKEEQSKPSSYSFLENTAGFFGRALVATPFDNFAKRSQIIPTSIPLQQIPFIFFQGSLTALGKIRNAYRGITFGFFYKGTQTFLFENTFVLKDLFQSSLGSGPAAGLASALTVGGIQTAVLHPFSTLRVRIQVNKHAFENTQDKYAAHSSPLRQAISQGHLWDGIAASLTRNIVFLATTAMVVDGYRQILLNYRILGNANKPNEQQETLAKIMSGTTATITSVFFDNVKTQAQVNGKGDNKANILSQTYGLFKQLGLSRSLRAVGPYAISEVVGLVGFYGGKKLLQVIQEQCAPSEPTLK